MGRRCGAKSLEQLGTRLVLPQAAVRRLHAAWAAKVVVCDLRPTTMGEGVGVASFITDDLIPALVSECTWQPPSHQVIADILERDFKTMKEQLKAQLEDVDRDEMILHADVWTDDWHRHWLGGILEWLCPLSGARQSRLICFDELEKWADDAEGCTPEMAQTVATALRAAWRSLDLGAEPAYLCTDNASPAVAIASALNIASLRCGCHLLVIPLRHLLWGKEAGMRGRVTQETPIEPKYPAFACPVDKLRQMGLYFYKKEDHHEQWTKCRRVNGVEWALVLLVDSSAKWQSSLAMVERALRNKLPIARFLELHPGAFPALTGDEWVVIGEIHKVFVDVNKCLANLQGDGKMLAQYVPHCNTLMQRLATRATAIACTCIQARDGASGAAQH